MMHKFLGKTPFEIRINSRSSVKPCNNCEDVSLTDFYYRIINNTVCSFRRNKFMYLNLLEKKKNADEQLVLFKNKEIDQTI